MQAFLLNAILIHSATAILSPFLTSFIQLIFQLVLIVWAYWTWKTVNLNCVYIYLGMLAVFGAVSISSCLENPWFVLWVAVYAGLFFFCWKKMAPFKDIGGDLGQPPSLLL